ncbi:type I-MYXAN CRISPR-associated protein Cmx8 [Desulfohalobiaceae bacterium Ax17]|uniref:type I-MYXAN CRISPR-associated protein Cmx8 n=1 Tax=Desulfovulcanus ferrireducens TaxID=2831190 RepID=UPI00207BC98B|nr:type I-MYXAN CRISPR-associated protein Cmx8 [Desulfovulcanus ferrireducens]MBT8764418.1 type I-MYXAN CRISPR-associated protein Cmx8 [Desulfovulcanus ferrireducens]
MKKEDKITLTYNLFDLPTAQHKAGLAGILILIESMRRRKMSPLPEVEEMTSSRVVITFTRESMQLLFDDLYDAEFVEVKSKSKWSGKKPKKIKEEETIENGKKKKTKYFIYDELQPKGSFFTTFYPDDCENWLELWRKMLWKVLRAQPKTRGVYEERAKGIPSSEASKVWKAMKAKKQKEESFAGSVFIGAQKENAELVPFKGLPQENFLLYFWYIASLVFSVKFVELKRNKERKSSIKWKDWGHAIVIPEPADIEEFYYVLIETLENMPVDVKNYTPASGQITLFEEGALEYLYFLVINKSRRQGGFFDFISGLEVYHMQKQGNNVRMLGAKKILPDRKIFEKYERMRQANMNPIFKRFYLQNVLAQNPWYFGSIKYFNTFPSEIFVWKTGKTPEQTNFKFFGLDCNNLFQLTIKKLKIKEVKEVNEESKEMFMAKIIYRIVRHYILLKALNKSGLSTKTDEKGQTIYPFENKEYKEAIEKVSMDAFLAMRGRKEEDFVEYFTGTICSVPQFLPQDEYLLLSDALVQGGWEKVKSLSLLAISAASYLAKNIQHKEDE